MKKFLPLLLLFSSFGSFSQVTLAQWDVANIGFSITQAHDTMPTVTPGPAGPSQTWNFTNLNNHFQDTLTFTNPNWLPDGSSFPTSNLAVLFGATGGAAYLNNSASSFLVLGQVADFGFGPMVVDLNPDEQLMKWPATFNTTFNNTSVVDLTLAIPAPPIDSARIKSTKIKTSLADAWGTVTTPLASNLPCLRVREMNITVDTQWVHISFPPMWTVYATNVDTTYDYSFWTPNTTNQYGFPVVSIQTDSAGNVTGADWLQAAPAQSGIAENSVSEMPSYPNPTSSQITFLSNGIDLERIEIRDISGKILKTVNVNSYKTSVDLEDLSAGTYFYIGYDQKNLMKKAGKFNISK